MKNKLKLILWGKKLQLPEDYDNLEFDGYELKYNGNWYILYIYKNNEKIKEILYWDNGNKWNECDYKNGKQDGKGHEWRENGILMYEYNYKNGKLLDK